MPTIPELLETRPELTLDELVEIANELLERYLPTTVADARVSEEVNPRLVRHYTTEEMLDPPIPKGRERRYTVDHLLQLLALRRLLAEGVSTSQIGTSLRASSRSELRHIVEEGGSVPPGPKAGGSAAALEAIEEIRRRTSGPTAPSKFRPSVMRHAPGPRQLQSPEPFKTSTGTQWERFEVMDGIELSIRSDVSPPATAAEQQRLLDDIARLLVRLGQRRTK